MPYSRTIQDKTIDAKIQYINSLAYTFVHCLGHIDVRIDGKRNEIEEKITHENLNF